jgi:23S rRNA pseudouridine955/2504/2580 synthase
MTEKTEMKKVRHFIVAEDDNGQRLDRWIKKHVPEIPYTLAQKLMRQGQIRVNSKRAKAETRLETGQDIRIPPVQDKPKVKHENVVSDYDAQFIKSLIIFDDGDVIAINKPFGLATQGGTGTKRHIDGMLDALTNKKGVKPRLVHRLDKDTSGVLLLARSAEVTRRLGKMFEGGRDMKKIYLALVTPVPEVHEGKINAPLVKAGGPQKEKMKIDDKEGRKAVSEYKVVDYMEKKIALVAFWPRTGRTHQIRVHAADVLKCPVIGDGKYGGKAAFVEGIGTERRLHLHAARVICPHPLGKGMLDIRAPLPPELLQNWKTLGFQPNLGEDPFADIPL